MEFKFECGHEAKDQVTGFIGIITSRSEHLTGCNTYWINPGLNKKTGKLEEGMWVDENRLVLTGKSIKSKVEVSPNPRKNGAENIGSPSHRF